jgi:RHH-type proline utilization regulon transcriptional repressor/proline dehydrogenase/delta 1-pyrroline-5-carboxylate dehydrogenase
MSGSANLDAEILAIGKDLAAAFPKAGRRPLKALDDKAMDLAAQDAELKAALFRFVDVVPACRNLDDLARHLTSFLDEVDNKPPPLKAAMKMADSAAGRKALGAASAAGVRHMAHRFIVGETPKDALPVFRQLWKRGIRTSVDLLGEATVTQDEAERYARRCHEALDQLAAADPDANLSVKVSALTPLLRPDAPERGKNDAKPRLRALLEHAQQVGAHLHIDMESLDSREAITDLVLELLAEPEFADGPSTGMVLQAYLRDATDLLDRMLAFTRSTTREHPLVVRLVKGAYWDHEVVEARQHGWTSPVFEEKAESDRTFEHLTRRLLDARSHGISPAIASHNLRSVAHAIAYNRHLGAPDDALEFQVLRGLGDDLQDALNARGHVVRTYCPVGDLVAGMAYLVRRLLENTANDSFLSDVASGRPLDELLAAP